jgi:hypothetical protein
MKRSGLSSRAFITILLIGVMLIAGCVSRFRQDLYLTGEGPQKRVKVEHTRFIRSADLTDPHDQMKYRTGKHNVGILTIATRLGKPDTTSPAWNFSFDESWRADVYLQLPEPLRDGRYTLQENSFAVLLEQYQLSGNERVFYALSGFLTIDSMSSRDAYCRITGEYANAKKEPMNLDGTFKLKIRD